MNEAEVTQMLRDAIDQDPKGRVWHVNTKHLVAFAQMVADKTKREMASQAWEAHLYEQGEVESRSKEDQKKKGEWVGLTDEEVFAIAKELGLKCSLGGNPNIDIDYARAIEQLLKRKNT
jgi:hypothetical protein